MKEKNKDIKGTLFEILGLAKVLEIAARDLEGVDEADREYADPFISVAAVIQQKAQFCLNEIEK